MPDDKKFFVPSPQRLDEITTNPSPTWSLASRALILSVGVLTKLWWKVPSGTVAVINQEPFLKTLTDPDRTRPILTITNHTSTVDDPLMWGVLPLKVFSNGPRYVRWSLAAHDVCFTTRPTATFFLLGQCLPIIRGAGIHQPAMNTAVKLLNLGKWVHIFPEGRINQQSNGLVRFKWGVGRLVMESDQTPIVFPIWHKGFDLVMPEGRKYPIPLPGVPLTIRFGEPIDLTSEVGDWKEGRTTEAEARTVITNKIFNAMKELEEVATEDHLKVKLERGAKITEEDVDLEDGRRKDVREVERHMKEEIDR